MDKPQTIGTHKVITMQYSLANASGVLVREARGKPVTYLHGAGVCLLYTSDAADDLLQV